MKFSVLGSSSSGNSSYIEMGNKRFLIDAGFSGKKTIEKLESINKNISDTIATVLINFFIIFFLFI